jgi:hypothetical protein
MLVKTGNNTDFLLRVTIDNPLDMSSIKIEELYPNGYARRSNLSPQHLLYHLVLGWQQVEEK